MGYQIKVIRHPSGRPITRERRGVLSRHNVPPDEPLTPGLRREELPEAIGFLHNIEPDWEDEDFDYTRETD